MRNSTRIVASLLGVFAGFGGPEHGYFEILQGNVRPDSLMVASMGPPCEPEEVWHLCEPAITIIPSFLVTGILATIVGLITMVWAAAFVQRKNGGIVLVLLSVALLLVGGGVFPPVIGVIAGVIGTRIDAPITSDPGSVSRLFAKLWPWPLVAFFVWAFGQFLVGHYYNALLQRSGLLSPLLIIGLLILSILAAHAHDIQGRAEPVQPAR
jgi:hypothetical protein